MNGKPSFFQAFVPSSSTFTFLKPLPANLSACPADVAFPFQLK
jgi:hypothetical protein